MRALLPPVFLVLLSLLMVSAVRAQPDAVRFERATEVEVHLPQSSVYEMLEDRRGFLWFATREGVGRWDGYTMRTWRRDPFNTASLPGNLVSGDGSPRFRGGNKLRNMYQQAEEIDGALTVRPCADEGTCIGLSVPLRTLVAAEADA